MMQKDEMSFSAVKLTNAVDMLRQAGSYIKQPERNIPVVYDVDVIIVGAGVTGVIAGIAAARQGVKTLVIDSFSYPGGNLGPGMIVGGMLHLAIKNPEAFPNGLGGIPAEFNTRVVEGENRKVGSDYFRDSQRAAFVAAQMLTEAGAELLLSSSVIDVIKHDDKITGVIVRNESGIFAAKAKVFLDCTGTAYIAELAGAPVIKLSENPAMGAFFSIAGIDNDICEKLRATPPQLNDSDKQWVEKNAPEAARLMPWARQAWENGDFKILQTIDNFATVEATLAPVSLSEIPMLSCRTRVNGQFDPGDGLAIAKILVRHQLYIHQFAEFLKKYVPGCEHAYVFCVSPYFHARGGKSIESEYIVDVDDVKKSSRFDDVIAVFYDDKTYYPGGCDIPYRMLLPKKIEGLLAAGRSCVVRGPQIRQRHTLQLIGQAAGIAAAIAAKNNVPPRQINIKQLQMKLKSVGSLDRNI